jgi:uncharacterized protein
MACKNKGLHMVTWILLVIGGLNWLLVGALQWEIGQLFGGMDSWFSKLIYILIGLSAIYEIVSHKCCCTCCDKSGSKPPASQGGMGTPLNI